MKLIRTILEILFAMAMGAAFVIAAAELRKATRTETPHHHHENSNETRN